MGPVDCAQLHARHRTGLPVHAPVGRTLLPTLGRGTKVVLASREERHPVGRGRGLRYSCPPSDQGRYSLNRVGVEFLHPSRGRRRIRRRYGFALPRRVDACGGLAGSQRRPGGGSGGCRNGRADCRLRDCRGQGRRARTRQHRRRYSFRAEGSARSSCGQSRSEPEQKESRQLPLARAGTQKAWLGSRFPGGNTSGTESPTKRKRMDAVNRTGGPRDTTAERTLDRMRSSRMSTLPDVVAGRHVRAFTPSVWQCINMRSDCCLLGHSRPRQRARGTL
jgi:hypothetical protein